MHRVNTIQISHAESKQSLVENAKVYLSRQDLKSLGIRVSNSSLLRWEQRGRFPRRIRMAGTTVAWIKAEVDEWAEARAEERKRHIYADF